jgi:hypothetical protein
MKDAPHVVFAVALAVLGSGACAMTGPIQADVRCHVTESEKLPAASGGAAALCAAIEQAAAARGVPAGFTVQVKVAPRAMLSADVTLPDGRTLATLHMAEMDRDVTRDMLNRFAVAVADHIMSEKR